MRCGAGRNVTMYYFFSPPISKTTISLIYTLCIKLNINQYIHFMNRMTTLKFSVFFSLILLSLQAFGQVTTIPTTNSGQCDGMAILDNPPASGTWTWQNANGVIQQNNDTLSDLCSGNYFVIVNENGISTTYTFYIDTLGGNSGPCQNYIFNVESFVSASSPGACDGSVVINMNGNSYMTYTSNQMGATLTNVNGLILVEGICDGIFNITFSNNSCSNSVVCDVSYPTGSGCNSLVANAYVVDFTSTPISCDGTIQIAAAGGTAPYSYSLVNDLPTTNPIFTDLCVGNPVFIVTDSEGCTYTVTGTMLPDSTNSWAFTCVAYPTPVSSNGACDGSAVVTSMFVTGTSLTYTNSDGQSNNSGVFSGLCEGIYSVTITNDQNDECTTTYLISSPANSSNGVTPNTTVLDSMTTALLEYCDIDLTTVDTMYVSSTTQYGQDSIEVVWVIFHAGDSSLLTEVYALPNNAATGNYQVSISIYCPGRTDNNHWFANDVVFVGTASVDEIQHDGIQIFQHIGSSDVMLVFDTPSPFEVTVIDMVGKVVYTSKNEASKSHKISLEHVSQGQYALVVSQDQTRVTKLVIR